MAAPIPVVIAGGASGAWQVDRIDPVRGPSLDRVARVAVFDGAAAIAAGSTADAAWILRGTTGHVRYLEQHENRAGVDPARPRSPGGDARRADPDPQGRRVVGARAGRAAGASRGSARATSRSACATCPRLRGACYHSRELGEPFDFLTWFEFAPEHASAFEIWSPACARARSGLRGARGRRSPQPPGLGDDSEAVETAVAAGRSDLARSIQAACVEVAPGCAAAFVETEIQ